MHRILLITTLLVLLVSPLFAQKEARIWYFGRGVGLDFSTTPPTPLSDGQINTGEGCASVADATGRLLFYTDGMRVWNRMHQPMLNGQGLSGDTSSAQAALIVPAPGDPSKYYLFTSDAGPDPNPPFLGIAYSIVDMTGDNGLGSVVTKNVQLLDSATEHLVAIRQCNSRDYWVVAHGWNNDNFHAWPITGAGGPGAEVISKVGSFHQGNRSNAIGCMKASPDGRLLVVANTGELFDFNPATGVVSNRRGLYGGSYGACFSPDGTKLYIGGLYQFDVSDTTTSAILSSRTNISIPSQGILGSMQLGPDGRIYITTLKTGLRVIAEPNKKGTACQYGVSTLIPNERTMMGLPNFCDVVRPCEYILRPPKAAFSSSDTTICQGECITFTDLSTKYPTGWQWQFERGVPRSSPDQNPGIVCFPDPGIFKVMLIVTNNDGRDTATLYIEVVPKPDVAAGPDRTICLGDSTQLLGQGQGKYQWSPAYGLGCTDCQSPFARPDTTTTYILTVTTFIGCIARDTVTVKVASSLTVEADSDRTICIGSSTQLAASGANSYRWSPATGLSCTNCPNPVAQPTATTTYTVTGTSGSCSGTDSVTVTVVNAPMDAEAGKDSAICMDQSIQLHASGGVGYQWVEQGGLSCTDCPDPVARPAGTTTYHVVITNEAGCTASDSVTITVHPPPSVDAGSDIEICSGSTAQLSATGGAIYRWSPATDLSCTDCSSPVASPKVTTIYHVDITDANGCSATDSVTVTVRSPFTANAGVDGAICTGDATQLMASDGMAWQWSPATGLSCTDCRNPIANPAMTITYSVTITSGDGCTAEDSVTITVHPLPTVDAGEDAELCAGQRIMLQATGDGEVLWTPASGLDCITCASPTASPATTTTYHVTLTDSYGCRASDSVTVAVRATMDTARASIARSYRLQPGKRIDVPVTLDAAVDQQRISHLVVKLHYLERVLRLESVRFDGALLDHWTIDTLRGAGSITLDCTAPPGTYLAGTGPLAIAHYAAFIGDTSASELALEIEADDAPCLVFSTRPGLITLDSICGLSYRMIELFGKRYALDKATPNPFNPSTDIQFSLGMDGPTRLVVYNALGEEVAVLVDEYLQPGTYQATWNAAAFPDGLYYYRLTSGAWSDTGTMTLRK
jgi:PKD repeat protein